MNSTALALVVVGALFHATWNLFAKRSSGGAAFVWLYGVVSLLLLAPLGLYVWYSGDRSIGGQAWIAIAISALAHLAYSLTLQKGYQVSDFSVVYPLARGTGPLFTVFAATVLLGETPTLVGWLGIALILGGILLISDAWKGLSSSTDRVKSGVLWGAVTGCTIAAYTIVDAWAVKTLGMAPVVYYALGLLLRTGMLAPKVLGDLPSLREQWSRHRGHILAVGALSPLAYILVLFAMQSAPLVYVAPARELSMMLGVVFGAVLLQESLTAGRLVGTGLMLTGGIALALAK